MALELREARTDDRDAITLNEAMGHEEHARLGIADRAPEPLPADLAPPRGVLLLAYCDRKPVAMGGIRDLGGGVAEIKRMYVDPGHRGRGIGRRILGELERRARRRGCGRARLDSTTGLDEAIALYRSAGYEEIPDYNGNPLADIWFEKRLDADAVPRLRLHDGVEIPQLGLGTFQLPPERVQEAVGEALRLGYRHVDTAAAYGNERAVGAAIAASGLPRDEVFVTTKVWNSDQGHDRALRAFEESRARLGLDHVDLYLIHWPMPRRGLFVETWRALERIRDEGGARTIGVSNFRVAELRRLEEEGMARPSVNQVELHPWLRQDELRAWHASRGVATEAWSPLAQGALLAEETVAAVAAEVDRTPAQVLLRWHLQLGNVVIPKSGTPSRIAENISLFDFELGEQQMARLARLDAGRRVGADPEAFNSG